MLDRAAQALKDWRLLPRPWTTTGRARSAWPRPRRRWDETTKVGLAGADRFDKQAETYRKATTCT